MFSDGYVWSSVIKDEENVTDGLNSTDVGADSSLDRDLI